MIAARAGVVAASLRRAAGGVTGPSIRSHTAYIPAVGTSSHVVNVPAGVVNGDILVFFGIFPYNPTAPTITPPSGWTNLWDTDAGLGVGGFRTYAGYRVASSEPGSYTWTGSLSDRPAAVLFAVKDTTAYDTSSNATSGNTTSFATPSITPSVNGCLIVGLMGSFHGSTTLTFTPDGAFAEYADIENTNNHCAVEVETKTQATAASISATATASVSTGKSAGILAFKP